MWVQREENGFREFIVKHTDCVEENRSNCPGLQESLIIKYNPCPHSPSLDSHVVLWFSSQGLPHPIQSRQKAGLGYSHASLQSRLSSSLYGCLQRNEKRSLWADPQAPLPQFIGERAQLSVFYNRRKSPLEYMSLCVCWFPVLKENNSRCIVCSLC